MILHIDDNPMIGEMLTMLVKDLVSVTSLADGIKVIQDNKVNLIILDGQCFITNGGKVDPMFWKKSILALKHLNIPMIVFSADDRAIEGAKEMGYQAFSKMNHKSLIGAIGELND